MFGHIGVRKNNAATIQILKKALVLIHDTDYTIRRAFRSEVLSLFIYFLPLDVSRIFLAP